MDNCATFLCRFEKHLDAHMSDLNRSRRYSEETVRSYKSHSAFFEEWLCDVHQEVHADPSRITRRIIEDYYTHLESISVNRYSGEPLSGATISLKMAACKKFTRFVMMQLEIDRDPGALVTVMSSPAKAPDDGDLLTPQQFVEKIDVYKLRPGRKYFEMLRTVCYATLLFRTGLRRAAACGVTESDMHLDDENPYLFAIEKGYARNGCRPEKKWLDTETIYLIHQLLDANNELTGGGDVSGYSRGRQEGRFLFIARTVKKNGGYTFRQLSPNSAGRQIRDCLGVPCHVLRKSFARNLGMANVPAPVISSLLGHRSGAAITWQYTQPEPHECLEALRNLSPGAL